MIENVYDNRKTDFDAGSCSVNALAILADLSWEDAQGRLALAGRRKNRPCSPEVLTSAAGVKFIPVEDMPCSLGEFARRHPRGRFLLHKYNHYFAMIDGASHDYYRHNDRTTISEAWKVSASRRRGSG